LGAATCETRRAARSRQLSVVRALLWPRRPHSVRIAEACAAPGRFLGHKNQFLWLASAAGAPTPAHSRRSLVGSSSSAQPCRQLKRSCRAFQVRGLWAAFLTNAGAEPVAQATRLFRSATRRPEGRDSRWYEDGLDETSKPRPSAGPVARLNGRVARATQFW